MIDADDVVFIHELVAIAMAHDLVARIGGQRLLTDLQPEACAIDDLRYIDPSLDHHVYSHAPPLVEGST
jgi:hypothetical protein